MKAQVRLFARLSEIVGRRQLEVEVGEGVSVGDLFQALCARYPGLRDYEGRLMFAVDARYVEPSHPLRGGEEVALIPAVSGGGPAYRQAGMLFEVGRDALDPQRLIEHVRKDESGAVAVFLGVVRDNSLGRRVLYLEYDAYPEMATKVMRQIGEEAMARWPLSDVAVQHRIGRLEVGETSMVVAVASPHRQEAFAACHHIVERIKAIVPVWKKEVWEGGEAWIEGEPAGEAEA